jgi:replicative DNA helicase
MSPARSVETSPFAINPHPSAFHQPAAGNRIVQASRCNGSRGDQEWADANPDKVNEAQVIIAKQRNGPCDTVKLTFLGAQTRFVNYNPGV